MDPRSEVVLRQHDYLSGRVLLINAPLDELVTELTPEIETYMDSIQAKSLNYLFDLQTLRDQCNDYAKVCKDRADEFAKKAKNYLNRDQAYRKMQVAIMLSAGQKTMENGAHRITLVKNPVKVEIVEESDIPSTYQIADVKMSMDDYNKIKDMVNIKSLNISIDKKSISEIYKSSGVEIAGVKYVQDDDVRVK